MQLRIHLNELHVKISELLKQPHMKAYLQTQVNQAEILQQCQEILLDIERFLAQKETYLIENYEKIVEENYSFLDFYETLLDESSKFASHQVCKMFTLAPDITVYDNYFSPPNTDPQTISYPPISPLENTKDMIVLEGNSPEYLQDDNLSENLFNSLPEIISILFELTQERKKLDFKMIEEIEYMLNILEILHHNKKTGIPITVNDKINLFLILEKVGCILLNQDVHYILMKNKKNS